MFRRISAPWRTFALALSMIIGGAVFASMVPASAQPPVCPNERCAASSDKCRPQLGRKCEIGAFPCESQC
jgi:hypothetical protein